MKPLNPKQAALKYCAQICETCGSRGFCDRSELGECMPTEFEYDAFIAGAESREVTYGINELSKKIHCAAVAKGFYETQRETGTLLMLVVSELSEALEADRKDRRADLEAFNAEKQPTPRTGCDPFVDRFELHIKDTFEDELADAVIRLLDLSNALNIDIEKHIELKMRYNSSRPHKHGKKY